MGWNGRFLCVCAERAEVFAQVADAVQWSFEQDGSELVGRAALPVDTWRHDRRLFGIAISPPVSGWIGIADSERDPSSVLARRLAEQLATPVVMSSIAEICDPPEPEVIEVYGADPDPQFYGLYQDVGFRYRDLVAPRDSFSGTPRFDPGAIVLLTFRAPTPRPHADHREPAPDAGDDIPF